MSQIALLATIILTRCYDCRGMRQFARFVGSLILAIFAIGTVLASPSRHVTRFESPDKQFAAVIYPAGNPKGHVYSESRVSIFARNGTQLLEHDFSSSDGEHGYAVDGAQWTPDCRYFVFRLRSSGGHSPMFAPIVFWSRKANRFYSLKNYTGDQIFEIAAPDRLKASTWPERTPTVVSLSAVKEADVTELQ